MNSNTPATRQQPSASPSQGPGFALTPLMWWGLVLAVTMLSFFVHLLEQQVERGDATRAAWQQQNRAAGQPAAPHRERAVATLDRASPRIASR